MKNLYLIAATLLTMCVSSCNSVDYKVLDKAYLLEQSYRTASDSIQAEQIQKEFLSVWFAMNTDERTEYKNYRDYQETLRMEVLQIENEGLRMLHD